MDKRLKWMFFQRRYASGQQAHEKKLKVTDHSGNANLHNFYFMSIKMAVINKHKSVGKKVEKLEPLCTAGENAERCRPHGKQYGSSSEQ